MLINGKPAETLALDDRGLLYGDGVFETIAVREGRPLSLDRHLRRLRGGCQRLAIRPPPVDIFREEAAQVCKGRECAVLKIIMTRGCGARGYRPDPAQAATRILTIHPWPDYPLRYSRDGIAVTVCRLRLGRNPTLAGIKHLNRLENVLARGEWDDGYQEGLLRDATGLVVEGTMSNLFVIKDDKLITPDLRHSGVAGIMRERIIEQAETLNLPLQVREVVLEDVLSADGLFFCNSLIGIWPVLELGQSSFKKHPLVGQLSERLGLGG